MRITLGEVRRLVREALKSLKQRKTAVDALIVQNPDMTVPLKKLYGDGSFMVSPSSVSQHERFRDLLRPGESQGFWEIRDIPAESSYVVTTYKERSRAATPKTVKKLDLKELDALPELTFTKRQLFDAAKATGQHLYADEEFVWNARSPAQMELLLTNTYRLVTEFAQNVGDEEEAYDFDAYVIPTFSYVFFPSRPGTGIDTNETMSFVSDWRKLMDVDGNIYVVDNTGVTAITIVRPTVKTRSQYASVVAKALEGDK